MTRITKGKLQSKILQEQGIVLNRPAKHKHRAIKVLPGADLERLKTTHMKYYELKFGEPIERILMSGSLSAVVKRLNGELDAGTISRWIKRLGLRYSPDNLPSCDGCRDKDDVCQLGICVRLYAIGRLDLAELKRKEVLGEQQV